MINKIPRSKEEIENNLKLLIHKLKIDAERYDDGDLYALFGNSALLRTLYHQSHRGKPLIDLLKIHKDLKMISYSSFSGADIDYGSVIAVRMKDKLLHRGSVYNTFLYSPNKQTDKKILKFNEWWLQTIFQLGETKINRKDLVKVIADQNGGAHFDSEINSNFYHLLHGTTGFTLGVTRNNYYLLGSTPSEVGQQIKFVDLPTALIREVIDETIDSFNANLDFINEPYHPNFKFNFDRKLNLIFGAPKAIKK